MFNLMKGDCLEVMKGIPDNCIDLVLTDPPYGTTACKWDSVIDFQKMWKQLRRITHSGSTVVMTSAQPFTTALIGSNLDDFKYCYTWVKNRPSNYPNAKRRPLTKHEDVCVWQFGPMHYNPQKTTGHKPTNAAKGVSQGSVYRGYNVRDYSGGVTERYPTTILDFKCERGLHPTQKPIALGEHLIKTYSSDGDTVLDFCMGSGSFGVAAINLNRKFIGIEKEREYFEISKERIKKARS